MQNVALTDYGRKCRNFQPYRKPRHDRQPPQRWENGMSGKLTKRAARKLAWQYAYAIMLTSDLEQVYGDHVLKELLNNEQEKVTLSEAQQFVATQIKKRVPS